MDKQESNGVRVLDINEQTIPIIEQITEGMPGGFFIYHADGNETLIYANKAMVNIFGCDSLEDFRAYIGNSFRGIVHPEELEEVEQSIRDQISKSSKGLDYVEYRVLRKDGGIRWVRDYGRFLHTSLYGDVFYVFVEDATERHLKEVNDAHTLQEARERLEVLRELEHETTALRMVHELFCSSMWSLEFNGEAKIVKVDWSDEFRIMMGYHDKTDFPNALGSWSDLLHEDDKERVMEALNEAVTDQTGKRTHSVEYRLLTKDRGWRWFQAAGKVSRREDGSPMTFMGIVVDITRQKLTEAALETQRKLLEDALRQTQQAKRARSIFLNNMSHDLRTPMNAITGFTTLANLSLDDKEVVADCLNKIMLSADNLQTLIANLLDMSYIESGDVRGSEAPCSLPELLEQLEASVRAEARIKELELTVESDGLIHKNVVCDRQKLFHALTNITGNALKFTPPGGQISVRLTESKGAPAGHGFYVFKIRDTGIGIKEELLERIFEPFERTAVPFSGLQGLGLGLAITQNIVESMGGSIGVESEEKKGTEFTISVQFPLAEEVEC